MNGLGFAADSSGSSPFVTRLLLQMTLKKVQPAPARDYFAAAFGSANKYGANSGTAVRNSSTTMRANNT